MKRLGLLLIGALLAVIGIAAGVGAGAGSASEFWLHCKSVPLVCTEETPPTTTVTETVTVTGTTPSTPTVTPTATPMMPSQTPTPTATPGPQPPPGGAPCVSGGWPAGSLLPARIAESTGVVISVSSSAQLRSALAAVNPGSIIRLAPGHYGAGESGFDVNRSGTASAPITVEGSPGAVLDTTLQMGASYVRVRNLEIDGTTRSDENGVEASGGSNVELCGLYIHDITRGGIYPQGIFTTSSTSHWQIINVRIERIGLGQPTPQANHGLYLNGSSYLLVNVLVNQPSGFGFQAYPNLDDSIFTHVTLTNAQVKSGMISTSGSTGNRIFNSVAVGNHEYGYDGTAAGDHLISFGNGAGAFSMSAACTACITSNPLLDSAGHPQSGSSTFGFSDPRYSPGFDLAGNTRSATPTAGAYEH